MRGDGGGDGKKWWQDPYHESPEGKLRHWKVEGLLKEFELEGNVIKPS